MENFFKRIKANYMVSAALLTLFGLVLLIWPKTSTTVLCIALGCVLVVCGVIRLAVFWASRDGSLYSSMNLLSGIVLLVVGIWIVVKPEGVLFVVPIVIGIVVIFHGVHDSLQAVSLYKAGYEKWWVALILGIITTGLGILLVVNPFEAIETIVRVVGICLMYDGISDMWIVSRVSKTVKQARQDLAALDAEYVESKEK